MANVQEEIWKDIPGYEGFYQVSDLGRVRSFDRPMVKNGKVYKRIVKGRILCPRKNKQGYLCVQLSVGGIIKNKRIHRMVALAFFAQSRKSAGSQSFE